MKSKSEVFDKFITYKKFAENAVEAKIKTVRSDNGTEYVNKKFIDYFENNGIRHEKSATYSPQQNGVAERFNRSIIEKTRCLLIDSKLEKSFWAEAAQAAVNVLNVIPNGSDNISPNERWNGKKCNVADFRVFGCRAMVWQLDQKRKKLDQKSYELIFLRNADDAKAYRLYDVNNRKIIISS